MKKAPGGSAERPLGAARISPLGGPGTPGAGDDGHGEHDRSPKLSPDRGGRCSQADVARRVGVAARVGLHEDPADEWGSWGPCKMKAATHEEATRCHGGTRGALGPDAAGSGRNGAGG